MDMSGLIIKMAIFVVLMVIGYVLARSGTAGKEFTKATSKLVVNVFMSATIINAVFAEDISFTSSELINVMLVLSVSMLLCYLIAAIAARLVPLEREKTPLFELLIAVTNNMFIALPVVQALFGPIAVLYCSLSCIPFNVLLYTYGVWRLKSGGEKAGIMLKDIFTVPLFATFLALFIFLFKLPVPVIFKELIGSLSGATMPMSMILIGASLGSVSLLDAFKNGKLYIMSFIKLIIVPLAVWFVCRFLTDDPVLLATATVIAASPSAVIVSVLTIGYGKDAIYTSQGILQATAFSMLTIPAIVYVLV